MSGGGLKYLLKEGVKNLWTNRLMTFASGGVLTACLLIVGFAMLFSQNVNSMVGYLEDQNEIVVYLEKENTEERNIEIASELKQISDLKEVTYFDRATVFQLQKEKLGSASALLDDDDDNPYYAYYTVKEKDLEKITATVAAIKKIEGVKQVSFYKDFADAIVKVKNMVNLFGGAIIIALVLVSLVIIANTIRAAVFTRRKEINIMKYVGATDNFIRFPFMVEGLLLGLISAVLAFLMMWGGYTMLANAILENSTVTFLASMMQRMLPFKEVAVGLGLCFAGAGIVTGMLGSIISVRTHLKV